MHKKSKEEINNYHKEILSHRILDAIKNPHDYISLSELKSSISRRNKK